MTIGFVLFLLIGAFVVAGLIFLAIVEHEPRERHGILTGRTHARA